MLNLPSVSITIHDNEGQIQDKLTQRAQVRPMQRRPEIGNETARAAKL